MKAKCLYETCFLFWFGVFRPCVLVSSDEQEMAREYMEINRNLRNRLGKEGLEPLQILTKSGKSSRIPRHLVKMDIDTTTYRQMLGGEIVPRKSRKFFSFAHIRAFVLFLF